MYTCQSKWNSFPWLKIPNAVEILWILASLKGTLAGLGLPLVELTILSEESALLLFVGCLALGFLSFLCVPIKQTKLFNYKCHLHKLIAILDSFVCFTPVMLNVSWI